MEIRARVMETLPNLLYKVEQTEGGKQYICYLSGRMRLHKIYVHVGDWVLVTLDPHGGKATNRITKRL